MKVLEAGQRLWRPLPPMTQSRSHHGLLAVNGYLYAVAGAGMVDISASLSLSMYNNMQV